MYVLLIVLLAYWVGSFLFSVVTAPLPQRASKIDSFASRRAASPAPTSYVVFSNGVFLDFDDREAAELFSEASGSPIIPTMRGR